MPVDKEFLEDEAARTAECLEALRDLEVLEFSADESLLLGHDPLALMVAPGIDPARVSNHLFSLGGFGPTPTVGQQVACGLLTKSGELVSAHRTDRRGRFSAELQKGTYRIRFVDRLRERIDADILVRIGDNLAREQIHAATRSSTMDEPLRSYLETITFPSRRVDLPGPPAPRTAEDVLSARCLEVSTARIRWAACDCCLILLLEPLYEGTIRLEFDTGEGAVQEKLGADGLVHPWPKHRRPIDGFDIRDLCLQVRGGETPRDGADARTIPRAWYDWGTSYVAIAPFTRDLQTLTSRMDGCEELALGQIVRRSREVPVPTAGNVLVMGARSILLKRYDRWNGTPLSSGALSADVLAELQITDDGQLFAQLQFHGIPDAAHKVYFLLPDSQLPDTHAVVGVADIDEEGMATLFGRLPRVEVEVGQPLEGWTARLVMSTDTLE